MRRRFAVTSVALMAVSAAVAQQPDNALALCDQLAASPVDGTRPSGVTGVLPQNIDAKAAMPACEAALQAAPTSSRVLFQLGRAYAAANMHAKAGEQYAKADALGHILATTISEHTLSTVEQDRGICRRPAAFMKKRRLAGSR